MSDSSDTRGRSRDRSAADVPDAPEVRDPTEPLDPIEPGTIYPVDPNVVLPDPDAETTEGEVVDEDEARRRRGRSE